MLESRFDALENWGELLVDLYDQSVVVLADGLKLGPDDGEGNIILSWTNGATLGLVGQFSCYFRLKDGRRAIFRGEFA